ncbi:hypothetical protein RhiirA4_461206 [Rhizophagus irregularis]|uniref:Uncharacterized protein n=1 Tax=Rhizophagus irregularis TaxID=588596 RepID=A0A2I1GID3_9GLOM|nr:hypothetical protein RhiirA4_461206 [Rhizophagus irregularis]
MVLQDYTKSKVEEIWVVKLVSSLSTAKRPNVLFDIRLINSYWYSKECLMLIDKRQEFPIKIIEDKVIPISEFYGYGLEFYKKALNLAITNGSNKNENNKQIEHEIDVSKISNPARLRMVIGPTGPTRS